MKKTAVAVALAAMSATAIPAYAEIEVSGNFGLFSDYRFRGVSQTEKKPAAQGGFDLSHSSGIYVGTWASNVSAFASLNGSGQEIDLYGGFSTEVSGVGVDVGLIRYLYPGNTGSCDTTEWYAGASYSFLSYKFSKSTTDATFCIADSKGAKYHSLSAEFPLNDQVTVSASYGRTEINNGGNPYKFSDYKLGASYALPNDYSLALDYIGTSGINTAAETAFYVTSTKDPGKKLYGSTVVFSVSKSF